MQETGFDDDVDTFAEDDFLSSIGAVVAFEDTLLEQVRAKTQRIKQSIETAWMLLYEVHERQEYKILGYSSFEAYCHAEFNIARRRAYQLIQFEKVNRALSESTCEQIVHIRINEGQARELTRLKDKTQWQQAYDRAKQIAVTRPKRSGKAGKFFPHGRVTAADIRAAVNELIDVTQEEKQSNASTLYRGFQQKTSPVSGSYFPLQFQAVRYLSGVPTELFVEVKTPDGANGDLWIPKDKIEQALEEAKKGF
jgi:hypothetical protein